jgi:AAA15 family ATPase/GTPase
MSILESLSIERFRGLQNLQLKDLGRINLLVGTNNSGKTSVLEALSIYSNPLDLREWWLTSLQRGQEDRFMRPSVIDSFRWLFPQERSRSLNADLDFDSEVEGISIRSNGTFPISKLVASYESIEELRVTRRRANSRDEDSDNNAELMSGLELRIQVEPNFRAGNENQLDLNIFSEDKSNLGDNELNFQLWDGEPSIRFPRSRTYNIAVETVTPVSHRLESHQFRLLSEARYKNFKTDVVELLKSVDSNIDDIEILADSGSVSRTQFSIYIQHAKLGLAPLNTFGDGIRRLLHIALKLVRVRGGLLLIDEIESTIHTEALQSSYAWLAKWCEEMDVQLFATTHSLEAVDALLDVTQSKDDLVLYRLESNREKMNVTRHDWSRLKILREELGQEVRW